MNMALFLLLVLVVTSFSTPVGAQNDIKLEINSRLPSKYTKKPLGLTATAASQMFPFIEITIKDVDYLIAFDRKNRRIMYIYTRDEDFRSSEGLKVGEEITVKWADIVVLGYFQLRGPADKNGWQSVIGDFFAFEGDFLERVKNAGHITTKISGFAKGYNY